MALDPSRRATRLWLELTASVVAALRAVTSRDDLMNLIEAVTLDMKFRHFALIDHRNLRTPGQGLVDLKNYPSAITEQLIGQQHYRRDPVIRGCLFADGAFLWSDLSNIIRLDRHDRASFEIGAREGLNEGITVPYVRLGDPMGSCTFAGTRRPDHAHRFLGAAQMIGIFAYQSARRLVAGPRSIAPTPPTLHPRPRDCVVLAGRGYSNKLSPFSSRWSDREIVTWIDEVKDGFGGKRRKLW